MSSSLNRVSLIGNLARDPEIRSVSSGDRIANLSVATSEAWNDRSGERKERTEFHRVVVFAERLVPTIEKYLRKGSRVFIEGSLTTRKWTDQSGQDRYSTEIVLNQFRGELIMLDAPPSRETSAASRAPAQQPRGGQGGGRDYREELNDEVPFISWNDVDDGVVL